MPISYNVSDNGNIILAVASAVVTAEEFIDYEIKHALDPRLRSPVCELLEIQKGALRNITRDDVTAVLESRKKIGRPRIVHRCGLVVASGDAHDWDIAKFYEGMNILHSPEVVIVFADTDVAKTWLGLSHCG